MCGQTQPRRRPAESPSRIVKGAKKSRVVSRWSTNYRSSALQQFLEIADGRCIREIRFAQLDLITIFESTEQFDAFEGAEPQATFQICVRRKVPSRAASDSCEKFGEWTSSVFWGSPAQRRLDRIANHVAARFLRRTTGKIFFGPDEPGTHMLIFGQRLVCARDDCSCVDFGVIRIGIGIAVAQNQNCTRLSIPALLQADDDAVPHFFLLAQRCFEILGVNVHSRRCDVHFFLAALKKKIPLLIDRAQIAGAIPAFIFQTRHWLQFASIPIAAGNATSPHQNFAIIRQLDFASRKNFANRAAASVEGMVQADQRSGLGQSVSLNNSVAEPMPEFFGLAIKRGAAADHSPEFPSELASHLTKRPPATQKMLTLGSSVTHSKAFAVVNVIKVAFDLLPERLDHARNSHQHRYSLAANRSHYFRRVKCIFEHDRAAEQRRKKNSQKLTEDMAQRQEVQKTNWMYQSLIFQVFLNFVFNWD